MVDSLKYDSTKFEEEATGYRHRYQEPPEYYRSSTHSKSRDRQRTATNSFPPSNPPVPVPRPAPESPAAHPGRYMYTAEGIPYWDTIKQQYVPPYGPNGEIMASQPPAPAPAPWPVPVPRPAPEIPQDQGSRYVYTHDGEPYWDNIKQQYVPPYGPNGQREPDRQTPRTMPASHQDDNSGHKERHGGSAPWSAPGYPADPPGPSRLPLDDLDPPVDKNTGQPMEGYWTQNNKGHLTFVPQRRT